MNVFVFDIETIPDLAAGRALLGLSDKLPDTSVFQAMQAWRKAQANTLFMPHYLQRIVAISCVLRTRDTVAVWSLGDESSSEADLITRFFKGIENYVPTLVSWNGGGFDLPVLHYRALKHGVKAGQYWELGDNDNQFRYNNYISRYHARHTDLMDVLASYQGRANAPLDAIATSLGLPGKMGMSGDKVFSAYQAGHLKAIREYCEIDVLNTYGVYLHFELMRGRLSQQAFDHEKALLIDWLKSKELPHFNEFLKVWEYAVDVAV